MTSSSLATDLPATPTAPPAETEYHFTFRGNGADLFSVYILNVLKTILTVGMYYFWGRVKIRQYIWGQTEVAGDRFGYHGTGRELLIGWLKAMLAFGSLLAAQMALDLSVPMLGTLILWLGLVCLWPLAKIGSLRYRLSRTSWRGIRFSFRGDIKPFLLLSVPGLLLSFPTLGLYTPFYECAIRRYFLEHSRLGNIAFGFEGSPKKLLRIYLVRGIVAIVGVGGLLGLTLYTSTGGGVYVAGFGPINGVLWIITDIGLCVLVVLSLLSLVVRRRRFFWDHTTFGPAHFRSTVSMGNLAALYAGNVGLLLVTLGLGSPWVTVRSRQYDCAHLTLTGTLDLEHIQQDALEATATGEELGGLLDVDVMAG